MQSLYSIYHGPTGTTIKAESGLDEHAVKIIALNQLDVIPSLIHHDPRIGRRAIHFGIVQEQPIQ